ncbi:SusC/RagA family TonB-linked outer membrane protein [Paraflavitalea soli]|uniref:SusC/RagA family TonB-linked outer membrane protein n=1 Tax=Paraflavitalea soli TaxID=2315862 RepID=A0A3B7MR05_9BACT|nr:SusC/RagA family TonB-linked outer membrane protein [Paraflavitalea soli]AXY76974.1 SusC/RagA family TonB-linked outer membrane protein [Paraflavitalea soli]
MTSNRLFTASALLLLTLCFSAATLAQDKIITGKISDSKDGTPVVGASVVPKGSAKGTSTGTDGSFRVNVAEAVTTLVVSSVGYITLEVDITGKTVANISLEASNSALNEIVVVGYGTARKKDLTGAVASVKAKDFNQGIQTSPDQLIQGKVAGVQIMNNSGQPGGGTTVKIRGNSSIRAGSNPLYVVDGIPLDGRSARPGGSGAGIGTSPAANPLNFMNPNDIASIEVLKDASATAIYGSRGAYGVIIINTKRGQTGAPKMDVNFYVGMSKLIKQLKVLDAGEYKKALADYGLTTGDYGGSVDAMDAILRTAWTQNYDVGFSGGTENGRYRISAGYLDQEGIIRKSNFKKYSTNISGFFKFLESKRLGVDYNIIASQTVEQIAPVSNDAGFTGSIIGQALQWNPTRPLIRKKANGQDSLDIDKNSSTVNPLAMSEAYDDHSKVTSILGSISPYFKITKDLEYRMLFSINYSTGIRNAQIAKYINLQDIGPSTDYPDGRGVAYTGTNELTTKQFTHTLNYNKKISPSFNINALLGFEYMKFDTKGSGMNARDFGSYNIPFTNYFQFSSQSTRGTFSFADPTTELQSYFGRAIVNYKDRYLLTATFRADGSTKFGKNNRYGYFPSFAVAWNVQNESFFDVDFINTLKVRAGWGKTGSQDAPPGSAQERYGFNGPNSTFKVNAENKDLKWQADEQIDIGLDFTIWENRISGTIDYFHKKTTGLLYPTITAQPAPPGAPPTWKNLDAEIVNKGVEVTVQANIIKTREFSWDLGVNASFLKNDVSGLPAPIATGGLHGQGISGATVEQITNNQPINVFYTKRFLGIDKGTGLANYSDDGYVLYYLGNPNPSTVLGISTSVNYKKFFAVVNMNGAMGQKIYNNTANTVLPIGNLIGGRNIARALIGTEVKENLANPISPSSRYIENGSYLKLANATISYNVGNIGKALKNLNVYIAGQNLFVITKFTGFDPEVNTDKQVNGIPSVGIEYTPYPSARSFQIGLNFSLQ